MPLQAPELDARRYDDIYAEARRRIQRYTPEWTDYNDSDPGITLLQLFAWLTELQLYALNRVPERNYIKFLQLVGLEVRPAAPARVHLTFTPTAGAARPTVPERTPVSAAPPEGGEPVVFETEIGLGLVSVPLTDVRVFDGSGFTDVTAADAAPGASFWPLGFVPQPGAALYLGFSQSDPPAPEPFPQQLRLRVLSTMASGAGAPQRAADAAVPPAPPVGLVWEYRPSPDPPIWRRLQLYSDESAALTREGYVQLEGPQRIEPTREAQLDQPRFWLRCRLATGTYPAGLAPQVDAVRPNTTPALNVSTVRDEILGQAEGHPGERFTVRRRPVQAGTLRLETQLAGEAAEPWTEVQDLLASGPAEPHFTLNRTTGEVAFGDGRTGRIPPAGADVVAAAYRYGGGAAGNVGPGLVNAPLGPLPGVDTVVNERAAEGGREEQTVEELQRMAPAMLRNRDRAVTAEDFKALAEASGGVHKATAIALAHPDHSGVEVPGAVTVVVVPDTKDRPPTPSAELIEHVCRELNRHRLLTTELFVMGAKYRPVTVEARVEADAYAAADDVEAKVERAIDEYLDPRTWPFGRDLHPTTLYSVIAGVEHVGAVRTLVVLVDRTERTLGEPVRLAPDELVYGTAEHRIVVEPLRDL